jgi:hypothetical protein
VPSSSCPIHCNPLLHTTAPSSSLLQAVPLIMHLQSQASSSEAPPTSFRCWKPKSPGVLTAITPCSNHRRRTHQIYSRRAAVFSAVPSLQPASPFPRRRCSSPSLMPHQIRRAHQAPPFLSDAPPALHHGTDVVDPSSVRLHSSRRSCLRDDAVSVLDPPLFTVAPLRSAPRRHALSSLPRRNPSPPSPHALPHHSVLTEEEEIWN